MKSPSAEQGRGPALTECLLDKWIFPEPSELRYPTWLPHVAFNLELIKMKNPVPKLHSHNSSAQQPPAAVLPSWTVENIPTLREGPLDSTGLEEGMRVPCTDREAQPEAQALPARPRAVSPGSSVEGLCPHEVLRSPIRCSAASRAKPRTERLAHMASSPSPRPS